MDLAELCAKLNRVNGFGSNRKGQCPAHDDKVASLSIKEADGKLLLKCHAACETGDILKALGLTFADLGSAGGGKAESARYEYRDETGKLLYTKIRYVPKDFRFSPVGYQGPRVPYNLPELLKPENSARRIVFVEGEADADRLAAAGFLATTAGSVSDYRATMTQYFSGRKVTIIPDNDAPGKAHAQLVAAALAQVALEVAICELPVPEKGDVSDFLRDRTVDDLKKLLQAAPAFDANKTDGDLLDNLKEKPVEFVWFPRIPSIGLTFIFGEAGIGKSTFAIDILSRMSRGDRMPMGAEMSKPRRIIALGFEDDIEGTVVGRFRAARADGSKILIERPSKYPRPHEPLIPGQLDWLRGEIRKHGAEVLFIDNIENSLSGGTDGNASLSIRAALAPLVELAQSMNVAIIALHHPKKGAMHSSAKEAMTGSQAYTNIARSTLEAITVPGQEGLGALAAVKVNGYPNQIPTLTYRLDGEVVGVRDEVEVYNIPTVLWGRETDLTADELHREHVRLMKEAQERQIADSPKVAEGRTFLAALPFGDGRTWADVCAEGDVAGFSEVTLRRARPSVLSFGRDKLWHRAQDTYATTKRVNEQDEQHEQHEHAAPPYGSPGEDAGDFPFGDNLQQVALPKPLPVALPPKSTQELEAQFFEGLDKTTEGV